MVQPNSGLDLYWLEAYAPSLHSHGLRLIYYKWPWSKPELDFKKNLKHKPLFLRIDLLGLVLNWLVTTSIYIHYSKMEDTKFDANVYLVASSN